jgi:hypothetical protein
MSDLIFPALAGKADLDKAVRKVKVWLIPVAAWHSQSGDYRR